MKTAISIPDEIFEDAERLAKRLKSSRSELYSRALRRVCRSPRTDQVTEAMDEALATVTNQSIRSRRMLQRRTLRRTEW